MIHDADGNRLAEYSYDPATQASTLLRECIWMDGQAVGVVENDTLFFVRTDHIGRPVFATDDTGAKVWEATYLPFGGVQTSSGTISDLRFPGQWFQLETGLHQNWMRDYDPTTGRYIQADPLGLVAGVSLYGYARQNPFVFVDPDGRNPLLGVLGLVGGGSASTAGSASVTGVTIGSLMLSILPARPTSDGTNGSDAADHAADEGGMCPLPPPDECLERYVACQDTSLGSLGGNAIGESRCQSCYNECKHKNNGVWPRTIPSANHGRLICGPRRKRF